MYSSEIVEKSPWDKLNIARDKNRPNARFYIENIFNDFIELHGDRYYKDDSAIIGGIASVNNINVTVIGIIFSVRCSLDRKRYRRKYKK